MKALAPNTLLQNRYLVVQLIGKGGMGEVYLGVDQRLGSAMAIKRTFFSDDETLMIAFEREAKTLARLRHPVLPKVSDHFNENDVQYLVMEHISGDDLSKRLELTNEPFPLNWVLFWADQLLDALAYLHTHEPPIIHRDIKPQNLKLTNENHIILLDFGLAKNTVGETRLSTTGSIAGYTPHYASMEQIRGTGTTARSDIYSLSATLYQLLTNTVPPDALTRADCVLNSIPDPVEPITSLNPEIPQLISAVILKGMSLSAEQRYESAREMQKALRDAYAQMQQMMSAQTVAFNASDAGVSTPPNESSAVPSSQMQTEQFSMPADFSSSSAPMGYDASGNDYHIAQPAGNFEATIMDAPKTGEKTEVLPSSSPSFPKAEPYSEPDYASEQKGESFSPDSTISLISYDEGFENKPQSGYEPAAQPSYDFDSSGTSEFGDLPKDEPAQFDYEPEPEPQAVAAVAAAPAAPKAEKKSGSKTFAIIGGLLVLAVVGIAAAGIGLYVMKPSMFTSATPTPVPTVAPTVEPSLEPSPEPTLEANINSNSSSDTYATTDSNTNTSADNTNTTVPTTTDVTTESNTSSPVDKRNQTATTTKPVTTPKTVNQGTTKTPATPPVKPTTAPKKPTVADRTGILQ